MTGQPDGSGAHRLVILRRFAQLAKAFFIYGSRHETRVFVLLLLLLSAAVGVVQLMVSYAGRNFMTSLAQRDSIGFYRNLWVYLGTFVVAVPVGVFYRFCAERLALLWRLWLTNILVSRFFFNHAFYRLRQSDRVDNPDQRISEDVRSFTTGVLGYLLTLINSAVTLCAFTGVLFSISWKLPVALFLYAGAGTFLSILIGRRLVGMHFLQNQKEADFRYALVRVRDNAESIAFFRGEKREQADLMGRFGSVVNNTLRIIGWNRTLGFFTSGYSYVALIVPLLVVGPMFIQGRIEFGVVTQTEGAFAQVLMALSVIVAQFEGLSTFAASINRLGDLWDELDEYDIEDLRAERDPSIEVNENARGLRLNDLTIQTPDREKTLARGLNFTLPPGRSALIMGESGTGKSSLLRTIAGLWQSGKGTIDRPNINRLIFLPQRPYLVQGSLREQLVYPQSPDGSDDRLIIETLSRVNLAEVLGRVEGDLGQIEDWTNILSLGEQQRISFARIFLNKPLIAFLDESTSALDEGDERTLYRNLLETGISFVSVGHRSTLKEFHDFLIVLEKDGGFKISDLKKRFPDG
ncbi:MAG: ABC transporter ATP-binding protein/permease [Verrucomicrobia bacterium]|nr:ABC transporter ATP-binding protein/permease [Verrucomicrobiota bacterium]